VEWRTQGEAMVASSGIGGKMMKELVQGGEANLLGFFKSFLEKQLKERNLIIS